MNEDQLLKLEELENLLNGYVMFSPVLSESQRADDGLEVARRALKKVREIQEDLA